VLHGTLAAYQTYNHCDVDVEDDPKDDLDSTIGCVDEYTRRSELFNARVRERLSRVKVEAVHTLQPQIATLQSQSSAAPLAELSSTVSVLSPLRQVAAKQPDTYTVDHAATKLQSTYRGYRTRGHQGVHKAPAPLESIASKTNAAAEERSGSEVPHVHMLEAEAVLRAAMIKCDGLRPSPDIAEWFHRMDREGEGSVRREQFFYVFSKFTTLFDMLTAAHVRTLADYFDIDHNGDKIDYKAFLRFLFFQPPNASPVLARLQQFVFSTGSATAFRAKDPSASGYLSMAQTLEALEDLGYGNMSNAIAHGVCAIFETRDPGNVKYMAMVDLVRDGELSKLHDDVCFRLRRLCTSGQGKQRPLHSVCTDNTCNLCRQCGRKYTVLVQSLIARPH
jgi:hypothetical protein